MTVEPLCPDDAGDLLALTPGPVVITEGAHGAVVRENGIVLAFALLRETAYGYVIDELRCVQSYRGERALARLAAWTEETVGRIAAERGLPGLQLGGICELRNARHYAALLGRGYEVVAHVLAKEIPALVPEAVS